MNQLPINDIKNLETIPDMSLYILIFLISLGAFLIIAFIYFIFKFLKRKKVINIFIIMS